MSQTGTPATTALQSNCTKIFVQRDYSEGTSVKFHTRLPSELDGHVSTPLGPADCLRLQPQCHPVVGRVCVISVITNLNFPCRLLSLRYQQKVARGEPSLDSAELACIVFSLFRSIASGLLRGPRSASRLFQAAVDEAQIASQCQLHFSNAT